MTAVPKLTHVDKFGDKWFRIDCPDCPNVGGVQRRHGPTLDACVNHNGRHAGLDAGGVL